MINLGMIELWKYDVNWFDSRKLVEVQWNAYYFLLHDISIWSIINVEQAQYPCALVIYSSTIEKAMNDCFVHIIESEEE